MQFLKNRASPILAFLCYQHHASRPHRSVHSSSPGPCAPTKGHESAVRCTRARQRPSEWWSLPHLGVTCSTLVHFAVTFLALVPWVARSTLISPMASCCQQVTPKPPSH